MKTYRDCIKSSVTKIDEPDFKMPLGLSLPNFIRSMAYILVKDAEWRLRIDDEDDQLRGILGILADKKLLDSAGQRLQLYRFLVWLCDQEVTDADPEKGFWYDLDKVIDKWDDHIDLWQEESDIGGAKE